MHITANELNNTAIVIDKKCEKSKVEELAQIIKSLQLKVHVFEGIEKYVIVVIGQKISQNQSIKINSKNLFMLIEKIVPIFEDYKLAKKAYDGHATSVKIGDVCIGGGTFAMIAGPCSVESYEQMEYIAKSLKDNGIRILRGGVFKPRTSPYSFQGLGREGLEILREVSTKYGLLTVTEVISEETCEQAYEYVDIFQIGARNMQNFNLLKYIGKLNKPVILKRGMSSTIDEWLNAAEYILSEGNYNVILCERGIRTFETATRNTLDISSVPVIKEKSHLPIIVDPSHAAGKSKYVPSLALAALAAGADGVMIEIHPNPDKAWSDGAQSLNLDDFNLTVMKILEMAKALKIKVLM